MTGAEAGAMPTRASTVGFVGLGMMGAPMAANIARGGHRLVVHDIVPDRADELVSLGAVRAESAAAVARQAGMLICIVETTEQVETVVLGSGGFIEAAQAGDLVICMSTVDIQAVRAIHARLAERGIGFIDAPVAGMRDKAGLKCFVGGDPAAIERARPVLNTMTTEVTRFGDVGAGTAIKLLNSMVRQANRIVLTEALAVGAKAGLDPRQMVELFSRTFADSAALRFDGPRILERRFDTPILGITVKDVQLQTALGRALGVPMPIASQVLQIYQMAKAAGVEDPGGVVEVYEGWTGVKVAPR